MQHNSIIFIVVCRELLCKKANLNYILKVILFVSQPPSSQRATKPINESIVSLLIKLHSKLSSGVFYKPMFGVSSETRIGDGPYYIGLLLNKMGHHDIATREHILAMLQLQMDNNVNAEQKKEVDPRKSQEEVILKAREERARKSAIRQQKVMESFKKDQKKFMDNNAEAVRAAKKTDTSCLTEAEIKAAFLRDTYHYESPNFEGILDASADPQYEREMGPLRPTENTIDILSHMKCGICTQEKEQPLGLILLISVSLIMILNLLYYCSQNGTE